MNRARLTPLDVEKQQFGRSFRGYSRDQVDEFMAAIGTDYEATVVENQRLRQELSQAQAEVSRYRDMEAAMREALVLAQKSAEEARETSRREAELTINEARQTARCIEDEARKAVEQMRWEIERLRIDKQNLVVELRNLVTGFLERIERSAPHEAVVRADV